MEGAATTVYAQGGRGNSRLIAWEGERTVTFTMEDALISPEGFMILSGAGLIDASEGKPVYQHVTETIDATQVVKDDSGITIKLQEMPYIPNNKGQDFAYVMFMRDGEIITEPYIPEHVTPDEKGNVKIERNVDGTYSILVKAEHPNYNHLNGVSYDTKDHPANYTHGEIPAFDAVLVDYYVARTGNAVQIDITPDKFGGNYYLEASTLFRDTNGVDMPAEFIIPNCKIQSNFNFTMASTGDPSTFTFTMDAFPDYLRFDRSKKVLAAIQIIKEAGAQDLHRHSTVHEEAHDLLNWD